MTKNIKMKEIQEPHKQIREKIGIDAITELAESIKQVGLLQPILVRKALVGYEIIAGHRRYLAHKQIGAELIEVKIVAADEDATILARVHENLFREDITAVDEANIIGYLHYECKWELEQICGRLRKSKSWVMTRIDIFHMPENLKDALREKKINSSVANELMKIVEPEKIKYFLEMAILHGVTARQVMQWRIDYQKESFIPNPNNPQLLPTDTHYDRSQGELECGICGTEMRALNAVAMNTCQNCWSEIYRQKKQRQR